VTVIVEVINKNGYDVSASRWQIAVETVLRHHQINSTVEMSISVQEDDAIQRLNHQFRGNDAPTDVLSFPSGELGNLADLPDGFYLGDLAIALPYASAQAERHNHSLADTLTLLVVHGVLHLLGYDHDDEESQTIMWEEQAIILDELGVSASIVPALEDESDG